jgi:hypothetical protein
MAIPDRTCPAGLPVSFYSAARWIELESHSTYRPARYIHADLTPCEHVVDESSRRVELELAAQWPQVAQVRTAAQVAGSTGSTGSGR